jgi:hypothetical protein
MGFGNEIFEVPPGALLNLAVIPMRLILLVLDNKQSWASIDNSFGYIFCGCQPPEIARCHIATGRDFTVC